MKFKLINIFFWVFLISSMGILSYYFFFNNCFNINFNDQDNNIKILLSPLMQFDVICIIPLWFFSCEISLTNLSLTIILGILIGFILFYLFFLGYLLPKSWQVALESVFIFVFRIVYQQIGKSGLVYFPFMLALFLFILILNLVSLTPFAFAVTSHPIWTIYFSLSICLGIFLIGILKHNIDFLKIFVPEVPLLLYPLMIVLEILSYIIRSFSLAIRLSANIIAGHTLVHILANLVWTLCHLRKFIVILPFILLMAIFVLEVGVACLQAYIFTLLTCMYLNDAINLTVH